MPIQIIREDITKMKCDAIVNPTDEEMIGSGGVDGLIHKVAGPRLKEEFIQSGGCQVGKAKITKGFLLPSTYIIHTVGPIYIDGKHNEKSLLESCYKECLKLAVENNCKSIAFPLISTGTYRYPKEEAFNIAIQTIQNFLLNHEMNIFIVVYDKKAVSISKKIFTNVLEYIDDHYVEMYEASYNRNVRYQPKLIFSKQEDISNKKSCDIYDETISLNEKIFELDESFSESLIRMIDERNMKDSDCYKKANIDRKLFNKIKNNSNYHPKKETAIAFAIALELNLEDTLSFLSKAGYTLSNSYKFDVIIKYFIQNKIYDVMLINETLFTFDQKLLCG